MEQFNYLGSSLKNLPYLNELNINLSYNNLGENSDNLKYLGDFI